MTRRSIAMSAVDIGAEEHTLVQQALASGQLANGSMLSLLEEEFRLRFGCRHAIAVSSGTAAMHLAVLAAGVEEGDFVVTTPFSFVATVNPLLYERAVPVFVDIDPQTLMIDPAAAAEAIRKLAGRAGDWERLLPRRGAERRGKLRAVIPVDLFGRVADVEQIRVAAEEAGIVVIEDACEAIGATLDGIPAGRFGDIGAFSFFPNKQMTTGEGGMVLTENDEWARVIRSLRSQGRGEDGRWLRHERIGYNYRLDELSAALGVAQVRRLDELLENRRRVADAYTRRLSQIEGITPLPPPREGMQMSWFIYVIRVAQDRDDVARRLAELGVTTRPYFWPVHLQPPYVARFGYQRGDFPNAELAGDSLLAVPFHAGLSEEDLEYVCDAIAESVQGSAAVGRPGAR